MGIWWLFCTTFWQIHFTEIFSPKKKVLNGSTVNWFSSRVHHKPNAREETWMLEKRGNSFKSSWEGRKLQNVTHFQFKHSIWQISTYSLLQRLMFTTGQCWGFHVWFQDGTLQGWRSHTQVIYDGKLKSGGGFRGFGTMRVRVVGSKVESGDGWWSFQFRGLGSVVGCVLVQLVIGSYHGTFGNLLPYFASYIRQVWCLLLFPYFWTKFFLGRLRLRPQQPPLRRYFSIPISIFTFCTLYSLGKHYLAQ